jgi:hypothetical protein
MTDGQIDKAVDTYRTMLRKHRLELGSDAVQHAFGQPGYVAEQVAVLRKYAEAVSSILIRHATVNRTRTPMEAIDATGRIKYCNDNVVVTMPQGEGNKKKVFFFKPDASAYDKNGNISDDEVAKQFELRGLKPADPYTLAAANEDDPAFADDHPNGTHWKDAAGKWCYAAFLRWNDKRYVDVGRLDRDWNDYWWFAGLRK